MEEDVLVRVIDGEAGANSWRVRLTDLLRGTSGVEAAGVPDAILRRVQEAWPSNERITFFKQRVGSTDYQVVFERVADRRSLVVFGAGHVGRSVALMGAMLGMSVCLVDDREDFLKEEAAPVGGIQRLCVRFEDLGDSVVLSKMSAVVIVTRGHQYDEVILKQLADRQTGYVGMIGSRRRVEGIFRRLRSEGVDNSFIERVRAPIGLDIGAASPQEIAVSIHAEIIKCFKNG